MKKIAALLRVSTDNQDTDNQRHAIEQAYPGADIKWFVEQGVSGKTPTSQRPVFQACIRYARKQKATLVVANLSRLGRDLAEVATFYRDYVEAGRIDLHAMDYPNLEKDTAGIFFTIQQMERVKISQRTQAAMDRIKAEIKANGFAITRDGKRIDRLGSANVQAASKAGVSAIKKTADQFASNVLPLIQSLQNQGMSLAAIAEELNVRSIKTARGGDWYASSVRNILKRAA